MHKRWLLNLPGLLFFFILIPVFLPAGLCELINRVHAAYAVIYQSGTLDSNREAPAGWAGILPSLHWPFVCHLMCGFITDFMCGFITDGAGRR